MLKNFCNAVKANYDQLVSDGGEKFVELVRGNFQSHDCKIVLLDLLKLSPVSQIEEW